MPPTGAADDQAKQFSASDIRSPWAVCSSSVGREDIDRFEQCVLTVKNAVGLPAMMSEDEYNLTISGKLEPVKFPGGTRTPSAKPLAERMKVCSYEELTNVEIFRSGRHGGKTWTVEDVSHVKKTFDDFGKRLIQPPMVLGHDEDQKLLQNSGMPSLGWAQEVTTRDNEDGTRSLLVRLSDVPALAKRAIQNKRYRRISAEIYADYRNPNLDGGKPKGPVLRRISLLGADIPEVKDLADVVALDEMPSNSLLYVENEGDTTMSTEPKIEAVAITPEQFAELTKQVSGLTGSVTKLGEQNAKLEAENKDLKASNASLANEHAKSELEKRRMGVASFIEAQKSKGKILPAWEEKGLSHFMESLEGRPAFKFSEGGKDVEKTPADFFREFVAELPAVVEFAEIGTAGLEQIAAEKRAAKVSDKKGVRLDAAVQVARKAQPTLSYAEAARMVAANDPTLVD